MSVKELGDNSPHESTSSNESMASSEHVPGSSSSKASRGHSLRNVFSELNVTAHLGGQASEYLKQVDDRMGTLVPDVAIKQIRLDSPAGAVAYVLDNMAIVLMFEQQLQTPTRPAFAPKSDNIRLVSESLNIINPEIDLLNGIIVTEADFAFAEEMATNIVLTLMLTSPKYTQSVGFDVDSMIKNTKYTVTRDVNQARDFARRFYPHAMLPYHTTGCVVSMKNPSAANRQDGLGDSGTAVMAILGYVDFQESYENGPGGSSRKFRPIFHRTALVTPIMHPAMEVLATSVCTSEFCRNYGWLDPFENFQSGNLNIGNLIMDAKGDSLYSIKNRTDFDTFIRNYITGETALLMIDVQEGVSRIPATYNLVSQQGGAHFARLFASFFHAEVGGVRCNNQVYSEFHGYMGTSKDPRDTRELNYLEIVSKKGGKDMERCKQLLIPSAPSERAHLLTQLGGNDLKFLYTTNIAVIDPDFIDLIDDIMDRQGIDIQSSDPESNTVFNYSGMNDIADRLARGSGVVTRGGQSNGGGIYGAHAYSGGVYRR